MSEAYLAPSAVPTRDSGPLPWCRLTLITHMRRRDASWIWRVGSIHVVWPHAIHVWMGVLLMLRWG